MVIFLSLHNFSFQSLHIHIEHPPHMGKMKIMSNQQIQIESFWLMKKERWNMGQHIIKGTRNPIHHWCKMLKKKRSLQARKNYESSYNQQLVLYYVMSPMNLPIHLYFATTHSHVMGQKVLNLNSFLMYLNLTKEKWMEIGMIKAWGKQ